MTTATTATLTRTETRTATQTRPEIRTEPAPAPARTEEAARGTILTTVVGSYPQPAWLRVYPTRDSLADATLVVVRT